MRRRLLLAGVGAAVAARDSAAARPAPQRLSVAEAAGGRTRIAVPLDAAARWRLSALDSPPRLVLDLGGLEWRGGVLDAAAGLVRGVRLLARPPRLVFDLTGPVEPPRAAREGGRVVLDLAAGDAAAFARLAVPGRILAASDSGSRAAQRLPLVVLDPGHGGHDPGAIGLAGTYEKRVVLDAALQLKRRLENGGTCRVLLTRSGDRFVQLADRVEFARSRDAALFMSIHADSAPGARGASVYTLAEQASDSMSADLARRENAVDRLGGIRLPPVSPEVQRILISLVRQETRTGSARLARLAIDALEDTGPMLTNPHRQAAFAVLKAPEVPSVLVEIGFLSDTQDEAALLRPDHRARIAGSLARAVENWLARHRTAVASEAAPPG